MKNELITNFTVDKAEKKVMIKREFAAPKKHVCAACTEPELLDQWWAPKPWKSETKSMDFSEGGRRLYAMVGPEGEEHGLLLITIQSLLKVILNSGMAFLTAQEI